MALHIIKQMILQENCHQRGLQTFTVLDFKSKQFQIKAVRHDLFFFPKCKMPSTNHRLTHDC